MRRDKILKNRQVSNNDNSSVYELALNNFAPTEVLCCESNNTCIANPVTCSSTNKLFQCWSISNYGPCSNNNNVNTEFLPKPSPPPACLLGEVYCFKGESDEVYDKNTKFDI